MTDTAEPQAEAAAADPKPSEATATDVASAEGTQTAEAQAPAGDTAAVPADVEAQADTEVPATGDEEAPANTDGADAKAETVARFVPKQVLLVEPDTLIRGSVVDVARQVGSVTVQPASSVELGEEFMKGVRIDGLLLSVAEGAEPLDFLARIRRGECRCEADVPVVVMAPSCDAELARQLKEYGVSRLLLQPFKIGDMAHTLEQLWEVEIDIPPQKPAAEVVKDAADAGDASEANAGEGSEDQDGAEASAASEPAAEVQPTAAVDAQPEASTDAAVAEPA